MLENIIQLSAGVLLGISSFMSKGNLKIPFMGEKPPGSFERFKQNWMIRIGLVLLVLGYALPIIEFDQNILEELSKHVRIILSFILSGSLVLVGYIFSMIMAKRDYNKVPVVGSEGDDISPGTVVFEKIDDNNSTK